MLSKTFRGTCENIDVPDQSGQSPPLRSIQPPLCPAFDGGGAIGRCNFQCRRPVAFNQRPVHSVIVRSDDPVTLSGGDIVPVASEQFGEQLGSAGTKGGTEALIRRLMGFDPAA